MAQTRSQLKILSKDKLNDEVHVLDNFKNGINSKFSEPNYCFNDFEAKYKCSTLICRFQDAVLSFHLSIFLN